MSADKHILLADQILLSIDLSIKELVQLRDKVEKIKDNCAKLRGSQDMAGVSTSALDYGLSEAKMASLMAHRSRVEAKRHSKKLIK